MQNEAAQATHIAAEQLQSSLPCSLFGERAGDPMNAHQDHQKECPQSLG